MEQIPSAAVQEPTPTMGEILSMQEFTADLNAIYTVNTILRLARGYKKPLPVLPAPPAAPDSVQNAAAIKKHP